MRTMYWWILAVVIVTGALAALAISPFNVQQALDAQLQLAAENPGDPRVFNDLGNLWVMAGEPGPAEEAYRRALSLDADQPSAHFNLGLLLQQTGRYQEALKEYRAVLALEPLDAWSHYQIGTIYDHWRDGPRAIQHYARAFSLDPELAFPEVNPHVIDNRFKTQALLRAHREIPAAPLAPRAYEEPVRIGALLIPPVPANPEEEATAGAERMAEAPEGTDEGAARRLTTGDLDPNAPSNQATPLGVGRGGSAYRPSPGTHSSRASRYQQLRQMQRRGNAANRNPASSSPSTPPPDQQQRRGADGRPVTVVVPQGNAGGGGAAGGDAGGGSSGGRDLAPSSAQPVRPGTASTGRLDIELLPRDPAAVPPVTLASVAGSPGAG